MKSAIKFKELVEKAATSPIDLTPLILSEMKEVQSAMEQATDGNSFDDASYDVGVRLSILSEYNFGRDFNEAIRKIVGLDWD